MSLGKPGCRRPHKMTSMITDPRSSPLWSFRPDLDDLDLLKTVPRGQELVRIFDHEKAAGKYGAFSYNPCLVPDLPENRGRYSARKSRRRSEWYSYLYVAENLIDESVALMECVNILGLGRETNGSRRLVDIAALANLSFAYATTDRPLTLLDVSSRAQADKLFADFSVLTGVDHRLTRAWARYFRSLAPWIDGLYYSPSQFGSIARGANFVLFAPHRADGDHISPIQRTVQFTDIAGRARLRSLQRTTNMHFSDMTA